MIYIWVDTLFHARSRTPPMHESASYVIGLDQILTVLEFRS